MTTIKITLQGKDFEFTQEQWRELRSIVGNEHVTVYVPHYQPVIASPMPPVTQPHTIPPWEITCKAGK